MKISFSTLGCPEWSWRDILIIAKDLQYDGIEIRGIEKDIYVPHAKPFLKENIENTKKELLEKGLEISCITSSCLLFDNDKERYLAEGKEYIDLAKELSAPYVRVLGDKDPEPSDSVNKNQVAEMLRELGDYAKSSNVQVLIETNGIFADSKVLVELMDKVGSSNVGILWDIHHPYRFFNESIRETYGRLKDFIKHIHVKDSYIENGRIRYCLLGQGDVPVEEAIRLLMENGYNGYVSLEWVKRWYYELEDPGVVFPHFINAIKTIIKS